MLRRCCRRVVLWRSCPCISPTMMLLVRLGARGCSVNLSGASASAGHNAPLASSTSGVTRTDGAMDEGDTVEATEAHVKARFGPTAMLTVRRTRGTEPADGSAPDDMRELSPPSAASSSSPSASFLTTASKEPCWSTRAVLQFKQLGFPVEIVGPSDSSEDASRRRLLQLLHGCDLAFLNPRIDPASNESREVRQLRRKLATLKKMCQDEGRNLKLSLLVEDPEVAEAGAAPTEATLRPRFACRTMLKDEWDAVPRLRAFTQSSYMTSANAAFISEVEKVFLQFEAELFGETRRLADVQELQRYLTQVHHGASCTIERHTDNEQRVSVVITVIDRWGNTRPFNGPRRSEELDAVRDAVGYVYRDLGAFDGRRLMPGMSLLAKVHWQADALAACGVGEKSGIGGELELRVECTDHLVAATQSGKQRGAPVHRASLWLHGACVVSSESPGLLRAELLCYCDFIFARLADLENATLLPRTLPELPFPTTRQLRSALRRFDEGCNIMTLCKGKPTPYAALGAAVKHHLGEVYSVAYEENSGDGATATIIVNDRFSNAQRVLGSGFSLNKSEAHRQMARGDAWRSACRSTLQHNFPGEFETVRNNAAFGDVSKTAAAALSSAAVSKEKIVASFSSLQEWLNYNGMRELGWTAMEVTAESTSGSSSSGGGGSGGPPFVGQVVATTPAAGKQVVGRTPPQQQIRVAKKAAVRVAMQQLFPAELEMYFNLNRSDHTRNDALKSLASGPRVYEVGRPFVVQAIELIERERPHLRPVQYSVERFYTPDQLESDNDGSAEDLLKPLHPRFKVCVRGGSAGAPITEFIGGVDESPLQCLRSALRTSMTTSGLGKKGDALLEEFARHCPVAQSPLDPPRQVLALMAEAFMGRDMHFEVASIETNPITWVVTVTVPAMGGLAICRTYHGVKRDAIRQAACLALRQGFSKQLRFHAKATVELSSLVNDIMGEPAQTTMPDSAVMPTAPGAISTASEPLPPSPHTLLKQLVEKEDPEYTTRHEQTPTADGFICRIFLQKASAGRVPKKGANLQEIGAGKAPTKAQALWLAAIKSLENLFEDELKEIVAKHASYGTPPPPPAAT